MASSSTLSSPLLHQCPLTIEPMVSYDSAEWDRIVEAAAGATWQLGDCPGNLEQGSGNLPEVQVGEGKAKCSSDACKACDESGLMSQVWIPSSFPKDSIKTLAEQFRVNPPLVGGKRQPQPLPTQCCVGPAVYWALGASILAWLLFLAVPQPVFDYSICDYSKGMGVSAYYDAATVWLCVSPVFVILLVIECKCLQYYILPVVQVLGRLNVFGMPVKFYTWLPVSLAFSLAGHMDLVTNGIFLATTLRTMNHCRSKWSLACIWLYTMEASIFGKLPYYREYFHCAFDDVVWCLWICMLIQALYGWFAVTPLPYVYRMMRCIGLEKCFMSAAARQGWMTRGCTEQLRMDTSSRSIVTYNEMRHFAQEDNFSQKDIDDWWETGCTPLDNDVSYEVSTEEEVRDALEGGPCEKTMYQTCFDVGRSKTGHGTALLALADSCRMTSITQTRVLYGKAKVRMYFEHNTMGPAFGLMKQVAHATLFKLALAGVLQTGLQLNLQVSLLAMTTLMSKIQYSNEAQVLGVDALLGGNAVDRQMVFSIAIGLFNFVKNFADAFMAIKWIRDSLNIPEQDGLRDHEGRTTFRPQMRSWLHKLIIALALYFAVFVYTVMKLWGVVQCPYSMMNINGCATSHMMFCLRQNVTSAFNTSAANVSSQDWVWS